MRIRDLSQARARHNPDFLPLVADAARKRIIATMLGWVRRTPQRLAPPRGRGKPMPATHRYALRSRVRATRPVAATPTAPRATVAHPPGSAGHLAARLDFIRADGTPDVPAYWRCLQEMAGRRTAAVAVASGEVDYDALQIARLQDIHDRTCLDEVLREAYCGDDRPVVISAAAASLAASASVPVPVPVSAPALAPEAPATSPAVSNNDFFGLAEGRWDCLRW